MLPAALGLLLGTAAGSPAMAASHSDAPLIKQDPQANITDVYAFIGTKLGDSGTEVLNVVVQTRPFSEPGDGVIYDRFADDALYSIHIANPATGETVLRYDYRFSSVSGGLKNDATILSYGLGTGAGSIGAVGDGQQNYTQTYSVTRTQGGTSQTLGTELLTPPPNVGVRVTPFYNDANGNAVSGATTSAELDPYTSATVYELPTGETVFAGPREDGFYGDTPGIFDFLDPRIVDNDEDTSDGLGQDGSGVDGFKGYNVLSYAIQIPLASLPSMPYTAPFADLASPLPAVSAATGVGVYATASRQRLRILRTDRGPIGTGPWVQVNRMGNPLFNEVFVAQGDKDEYNRSSPTDDARFSAYAENPELAFLINAVFGVGIIPLDRSDLAAVYIPDVLRVDTTTGPVTLAGQSGFNRLGFIGSDTATASGGRVMSSGWPNGRRLGDDVIDIALTALASGPDYSSVLPVGDNVAANDQVYHQVFPYAATPHAGPNNRKDPN
jgi:hypothetical protein